MLIWNPNDNSPMKTLIQHDDWVKSFVLLSNKMVTIGSEEKIITVQDFSYLPFCSTVLYYQNDYIFHSLINYSLKISNIQQENFQKHFYHNHWITSYLKHNNFIITASLDKSVKKWNMYNEELINSYNANAGIRSLTTASNSLLACGTLDGSIIILSLYDLSFQKSLNSHMYPVTSLFSFPDGCFASGSDDFIIKIWSIYNSTILNELHGHKSTIRIFTLLRDQRFISGADDSQIIIWDDYLKSKNFSVLNAYGPVYSLTVLLNGNLISGTKNGYVEFWDTNNLKQIKYLYEGDNIIYSLSSLPNGNLAICLSNYEYKILESTLHVPSLTFITNCNLNLN